MPLGSRSMDLDPDGPLDQDLLSLGADSRRLF